MKIPYKITEKAYPICAAILIFVTFWLVYIVNKAVPFMMDDEWYATMLFSEEPVKSLQDIFMAQKWHYVNWGGRSIAHGLLQITLILGEGFANAMNIGMLALLSYFVCTIGKAKSLFAYASVLGMVIAFSANWKESLFWQSGAANYLYMTVIILLFLNCYVQIWLDATKRFYGITIWIVPLGLMAGWSNENMGPTVFLMTVIMMIWMKKEVRKLPLWMYLGSVMTLVGSVCLILAPGNFVRSEQASQEIGLLWKVYIRCYYESTAVLEYMFPVIVLTIVMLGLYHILLGRRLQKEQVVLLLGAVLSWGAMIASPHYPDRATFGTMTLLICFVLSLARSILVEKPCVKIWFALAGFFIWLRGMYVLFEYMGIVWGWIR